MIHVMTKLTSPTKAAKTRRLEDSALEITSPKSHKNASMPKIANPRWRPIRTGLLCRIAIISIGVYILRIPI